MKERSHRFQNGFQHHLETYKIDRLLMKRSNKNEDLLGMPETNFNGRNTRTARNVRKSKELLVLILTVAKLNVNKVNRIRIIVTNQFDCITNPVTTTTKSIAFHGLRK